MLSFGLRRNSQEIPLWHTEPASRCDLPRRTGPPWKCSRPFPRNAPRPGPSTSPFKRYPDTCRALENAEADRDQARRALQQILDALDKVENARSSLNQVIQGLRQDAGALTYPVRPVCEKTHSFDRFPHFWGVPEKSDCRKSPLSDLNDSPQGLTGRYNLWADASSCNEYLTPLEN